MHGLYYFIGDRGSGKTSFATYLAMLEADEGRNVVINYPVNFPHTEMSIADMAELPDELLNAIVVIDEGKVAANARRAMSKGNNQLIKLISQLRKMQSKIFLISQRYRDVDIAIREDADFVIVMKAENRYSDDNTWFQYTIYDQKDQSQSYFGSILKAGWFYGPAVFGVFDTTNRIHYDKSEPLKNK